MLEMYIWSEILMEKAIGVQTNRNVHFANSTCNIDIYNALSLDFRSPVCNIDIAISFTGIHHTEALHFGALF